MSKFLKKILSVFLVVLIVTLTFFPVKSSFAASNPSFDEKIEFLLELQPGLTEEELLESITLGAEATGNTEEEFIDLALQEIKTIISGENTIGIQPYGGSAGTLYLSPATNKGDIFYTPSATMGIDHGHVGIYYTTTQIVESVPTTGVRKISYNGRYVESGTVMQTVSTTQAKRNAAADWANSRVGIDGYSYNFATNRTTSHEGAKNCSKLVWSAYMLKASIDIDKNGGTGVYPLDIRDSSLTSTYKTIK